MNEKNIIKIPKIDIEKNCRKFMNEREPNLRYASYDYCFNYFQSFYNSDKTKLLNSDKYLKQSCINLGFFLALAICDFLAIIILLRKIISNS